MWFIWTYTRATIKFEEKKIESLIYPNSELERPVGQAVREAGYLTGGSLFNSRWKIITRIQIITCVINEMIINVNEIKV